MHGKILMSPFNCVKTFVAEFYKHSQIISNVSFKTCGI